MKDEDYQYPLNPSTQSSTGNNEDSLREEGPKRFMNKLEALIAIALRLHMTHNQAVLAANAGYDDLGLLSGKTTLDPAKLLRARITFGDLQTKKRLERAKKMVAIYFDERIDSNIVRETLTTKVNTRKGQEETTTSVQRTIKEEHCPVVMYGPSGEEVYIETHKVEKGEAVVLAEKLVDSLDKQDSIDSVKVIGSDSCNKNTGQYGGAAACVVVELGRPLQQVLCLKHGIKLVWHCFFKTVDGKTTGPTTL